MSRRGPLFFEIPVELTFTVSVRVPVGEDFESAWMDVPEGMTPRLTQADERRLRAEAEGVAWDYLERKIDVGGGESVAAQTKEWELDRGGRAGVQPRRRGR